MRFIFYCLFLRCALSQSKRQPLRTLKGTGLPSLSLAVECTSQAPVFCRHNLSCESLKRGFFDFI